MTKQSFERNVEALLAAIDTCLKRRLLLPSLLLLYSGIDIMAWLNRPKSHADVNRHDFIKWTDKYLLPSAGLACNAADLYGARCSLLHSYTAESRLSREGNAKQIFYAWGTHRAEYLQELINYVGTYPAVAVHVDDLFGAFRTGIQRFKEALSDDRKQANLVYERTDKFFSNISLLPNKYP